VIVESNWYSQVGLSPSIGMGMVFSLTLSRISFGVLIQSAAPNSREQTVPSAPERELILQ
jgi:hypothetical protein